MSTNQPPQDVASGTYSSPYATEPYPPSNIPIKRRQSETTGDESYLIEGDEKRQRIGEPAQVAQSIEEDDFARMLAEASSTAEQQFNSAKPALQYGAPQISQNDYIPMPPAGYNADSQAVPQDSSMYWSNPRQYTRVMSLPMLETSLIPILGAFAQNSFEEAINIQSHPVATELGQAFEFQKLLFEQTKKIYTRDKAFLSADEMQIFKPEHRNLIRLTNLATFVTSVFGSQEVGFYELNDAFVDTFTREGEPLQKEPADLYLNLKIQMFLTALSQEEQEKTKEEHLDMLFPTTYNQLLTARHPKIPLSPSEIEFLTEMNRLREFLRAEAEDVESISTLSGQYTWEDFLRKLRDHLKVSYELSIIEPYMKKHDLTLPTPSTAPREELLKQEPDELDLSFLEQATEMAQQAALNSFTQFTPQQPNGSQYASQYPPQQQPQQQHNQSQSQSGFNPQQFQQGQASNSAPGPVPFPTQTAPTQVLYEQARQAAVAKSSPHSRRPGLPSQRRPWSTEEENALMAGLDSVKGPHWSQILALYGPKGSISEILKDRNQVQLKDKARNLKLFFLKSSIEVPYYLQSVTGELKTRAPTQAARRELEERGGQAESGLANGNMSPTSQTGQSPVPGTPHSAERLHHQQNHDGLPTIPIDSDTASEAQNAAGDRVALSTQGVTPQDEEIDFEKTLLDAMQQHNYQEQQSNGSGTSMRTT